MKTYLILILILGLVFVGCNSTQTETTPTGGEPFIGGTTGVEASFEPMGPEESGMYAIYEDESFPIQVILKNKGEYDIQPGDIKIKLYGISMSDFGGIAAAELPNKIEIEGVSEINDEGGEEIVDFGQNVKYVQKVPGTFYDATVFASYTYRYKTDSAVPEVCFKENLRDERVCEVEETKTSYSSGGPVQVQRVEEKPAGSGRIELDFDIENVGGGEVTKPGADFALTYGQVSYQLEPESERANWKCTHAGREGEARLQDGKATVRCVLVTALPKDTLQIRQVGLTLTYDYRDIIQKTIRIKKSV